MNTDWFESMVVKRSRKYSIFFSKILLKSIKNTWIKSINRKMGVNEAEELTK